MASTYLKRSLGTATSNKKGTWSFWLKKSGIGTSQILVGNEVTNDNNRGYIQFNSSDKLRIMDNDDSGDNCQMITTQVFRDTNAWYHFVFAFDTTQSTASDRIKWYVNGEQITAWDTASYPAQNIDLRIFEGGQTNKYHIGSLYSSGSGSNFFNGCMSHVHFSDGQQLAPTVFGSTDSTTGEWKINTSPNFTLGNNGFSILKDGTTITDQSSNSNDFTLGGGTLTFTHDNPSNIFATINPNAGNPLGLSTGNLKAVQSSGGTSSYNPKYFSNLGYAEGKFYWETKVSTFSTGSGHSVGLFRTNRGHVPSFGGDSTDSGQSIGSNGIFYFFGENTTYFSKYGSNEQSGSLGSTLSSGDIISCSHDVSAGEFKYYVNGSQIGSTLTGVSSANDGYYYIPLWGFESKPSTRYCTMEMNMGNGYFGTTAISTNSGNGYADADSRGKFNYSVPTNHRALCTRGLNQ